VNSYPIKVIFHLVIPRQTVACDAVGQRRLSSHCK